MDYSRKGIVQKQKNIKSTSRRLVSKFWIISFRMTIVLIVCVAIIGAMAGFGALKALTDTAPDVTNINVVPEGFQSYCYYNDGTLSQTFAGEQANRIYVPIKDIPKVVVDCFVALEDERFYEHSGIDIRGIFRAGYSVIKEQSMDYGASTITQQLLKNMVFGGGNEKSTLDKVIRKVQEQFLAIQLENIMTKEEILEYYLNYINLGNNSYGIKTAAQNYFGKELEQLTLSEASVIAPIAYSPTNMNPIFHPEENAERRTKCLENMLELNLCTKEEYDEALADDVYSRIQSVKQEQSSVNSYYSYFTDELIEQVLTDLQEKLGLTSNEAYNMLYRSGISIYTTQDPTIQAIVDKYYMDEANFPEFGFSSNKGSCYELTYALSVYHPDDTVTHYQLQDFLNYFADYQDTDRLYYHEKGGITGISELGLDVDDMYAKTEEFKAAMVREGDKVVEKRSVTPQPQSSFAIIEQATGKVVAIYGGRGEKKGSMTLNRASNTVRQVGSTFKVLASFLPALDSGGKTLATVYDDCKYYYPGGGKEVINWYSGFRGLNSIRKGIYNSLNIVAVKTIEDIGPALGFEYLEKLGFSTLVKSRVNANGEVFSDINHAIALGGLTDGVTNVELTAAYASIANGGIYNKPIYYTKILDSEGNVILSNETESTQIMKTSTAWLLTNAMLDTVNIGTGSNLRFREYKMPVAGKTGTASKNNDLWFVGYTPYYTASVWTGFDNNFKQIDKSYQQHLWRKIMEEIHATLELPYVSYDVPDTIVKATVCTKCGNLAVAGLCDNAEGGSCSFTEYFAKGTVPSEKCTCHVKATICTRTNKIANEFCPEKRLAERVYLIKDESQYEYPCETADTPYILPTETCTKHKEKANDGDEDATEGEIGGDIILPGDPDNNENNTGDSTQDTNPEDNDGGLDFLPDNTQDEP